MYACIHAPDAGALARNFSPYVEMVDDRTAVFTVTTWHTLQRAAAALVPLPGLGIAPTAEAAILAARNLPGFTFIAPGEETQVLGALPVDALPPDPEIFETLEMWGV